MNQKHLMVFGLAGAALTAPCCFTPILVELLGLVGLGAAIGYLDYVLLPDLAAFLGLAIYSFSRRNQEGSSLCCENKGKIRRK